MDRHYKITDIKNEEFYMLPKSLFENDVLKDLAPSSKIIYSILKDRMWLSWENEWCDDNGDIYFLFNQEGLAEMSCISLKTVQRSMAELKNCGLIDIKRQGQGKPSKLYINKLPLCPIKKGQNDLSRQVKMTFLDKSKCPTNNTNSNNTDNNHKESGENPTIDIKKVVEYLNQKTNSHYRANTKETVTHLKARAKSGYTTEDCIKVVDNMCLAWKGTKFEEFIRPSTLFSSDEKIEKYLNTKQTTLEFDKPKEQRPQIKDTFGLDKEVLSQAYENIGNNN